MWCKHHNVLWAGHKSNQRSKDFLQETCVKKVLNMSQANLVANSKNEHAVLLSNCKTQCGNVHRNDVLDGMQHFTCANNVQISTANNDSIVGYQNNNNDSIQMTRNPTSAR